MITREMVVTWMRHELAFQYEWLAAYFAEVAEACRPVAASPEELPRAVQSAIRLLKQSVFSSPTPQAINGILLDSIEYGAVVWNMPESVSRIPFPPNPGLQDPGDLLQKTRQMMLVKHANSIDLLRRLRTPKLLVRAELYAQAACSMQGQFHWIPAGPEAGSFIPKERRPDTQQIDHFAVWLNRGGKEPDASAYMNCWEAVFFSAYKAGLVSVQNLRLLHAKATVAARDGHGNSGSYLYNNSLMNALGWRNSVPCIPEIGLMPMRGDTIFVAHDHHVCICVDVKPAPTVGDSVIVMSLWKHPADGFLEISAAEFGNLIDEMTFAPCAF